MVAEGRRASRPSSTNEGDASTSRSSRHSSERRHHSESATTPVSSSSGARIVAHLVERLPRRSLEADRDAAAELE